MHRRALPRIEHPELDARRVDRLPHQSPQRVDLADDVPLGHTTDRRIAAHLPDGVEVGRQQRRMSAHPRGGGCGFGSGMSGADNDNVVVVFEWLSHFYFRERVGDILEPIPQL